MPRKLLAALLCWLLSTTLQAQSPAVEHHLSFDHRRNQYVDVRLILPVQAEMVSLAMPNWTPGSYLIRDFAAHVESLQARSGTGKLLPVEKTEKNRWSVNAKGEQRIEVTYSVWAGELAVNTAWVESEFAMLNGAAIFLYSEDSRNLPQELVVELPAAWQNVHVALPRLGEPHRYRAGTYDELIDSPILLGNTRSYPVEVESRQYVLVNQGDDALWDGTKAANDLGKMVRTVQSFWEVNPLQREYLFLNVLANGSGGLEHDYSTVLLSTPWQMRSRYDYIRWLALATHEFFHVWNVRRLRPQSLAHYDYDRESYTRELWFAEGVSSYYDNLLLFRSGLITVDEYMGLLAEEILKYELSPGRKVRSAELASFDTWIKHYKPDANSINSDTSYYRKGSLIGFVVDAAIRKATKEDRSLDDLMREMYRLYGPAKGQSQGATGYPPGAFQSLLEQWTSPELAAHLESLLTTVTDPDVDAALGYYGLRLERDPSRQAAEAAGAPVPADFGLIWSGTDPLLVVEVVVRGGSAAEAGVLPGDEVLAINSQRVDRLNIQDRMLRLQPGETAELLLARKGRVLRLPVQVQNAIPDKYRITIKPNISSREKQRMEEWLGLELKFIRN